MQDTILVSPNGCNILYAAVSFFLSLLPTPSTDQAFLQQLPAILNQEILPTLHSRHSQLMSEFAFWPSSPPHKQGGVFEMRSYELVPGTLLEWETAWKRGLEARKRFVVRCMCCVVPCDALANVIPVPMFE
jgi:hypothetical protein